VYKETKKGIGMKMLLEKVAIHGLNVEVDVIKMHLKNNNKTGREMRVMYVI